MSGSKIWLTVPCRDRGRVVAMGADWDPVTRRWFVNEYAAPEPFFEWVTTQQSDLPLLPDPVPETCWWTSVQANVPDEIWENIARRVYKDWDYHCSICGGREPEHPVEAHEEWYYYVQDGYFVQRLQRIIALCPSCHLVKHIGFARTQDRYNETIQHMAAVNKVSTEIAAEATYQAFKLWEQRNKVPWMLNVMHLELEYGINKEGEIVNEYRYNQ